ncbi:hypothetical protein MBT84_16800 [Streptomyces sp. MBT84]|nr:hypothetical protein [Streptomyces sp. MBT84]
MEPHVLARLGHASSLSRAGHAAPGRLARGRSALGQVEYAYSGAAAGHRRTIEGMLWSDPENEPPEELRDTQEMLRRLGVLMALAMVVAMIVIGIG